MLVSHRTDHDNKVIITIFAPKEVDLKIFLGALNLYQEKLKHLPGFQAYHELADFRQITRQH